MIDACMLGGADSTFLQQATHLTGGVYLRPRHRGALLQYLLVGNILSILALCAKLGNARMDLKSSFLPFARAGCRSYSALWVGESALMQITLQA